MKKGIVTYASHTATVLAMLILGLCLYSCTNSGSEEKTIVYINSYHQGFPPSDQITAGLKEELASDSFRVISYFMDTKRNPSEDFSKKRAADLLDSIREITPDILIVSDDNAMKYLVVPNFQYDSLPIVFCGVNWTAQQYDIANIHCTGVLEILPVKELLNTMKFYYPEMKKVLVLNENTTTSRKTVPLLDTLIANMGMEVSQELVDDFESWKAVFASANQEFDIIYLQTRGAIRGWDHEEALDHIDRYIQIPLVTCEEFMMPYAVFGLTQLSEEQGRLAARRAKNILNGTSAKDIPLTRNKLTKVWINPELADKLNFKLDSALLQQAHKVN